MRCCLGVVLFAMTAALLVGMGTAARADDPKAKDDKAKAVDPPKSDDKPFDTMKELFSSQKDMYQNHLNTLTLIMGIVAGVLALLQLWFAWSASERQRLVQVEQLKREADREQRDKAFDTQLGQLAAQSAQYTATSTGLISQMTSVLQTYDKNKALLVDTEALLLGQKAQQTRATHEANQLSAAFLSAFSIHDDGLVQALTTRTRQIDTARGQADPKGLRPEVFVVEGMYQSEVFRNDAEAVEVWRKQVLELPATDENKGLLARAGYYAGLSLIRLGRYPQAIERLDKALDLVPTDVTYQLARAQARIYAHRAGKKLPDSELTEVQQELAGLYEKVKAHKPINRGKMSEHAFRSHLVYVFVGFLIHERAIDSPAALAQAATILVDEIATNGHSSAELDGLRCALAFKRKTVSVESFSDYLSQCDVELQANRNPFTEFTHNLRKARLLGRRAAAVRVRQNDPRAGDADDKTLRNLIAGLRRTLLELQRSYSETAIYSPLTRRHELFHALTRQLSDEFAPAKFDAELKDVTVAD